MELSQATVGRILEDLAEDGQTVYDWADEYGEPGYSFPYGATTPTIVLGNYWCRCGKDDGALHSITDHHPRLWAQLETQGVQLEWSDEWLVEDGRAYRTQPDSYSWQPSYRITEYGEVLAPEDGIDAWLEEMIDNPDNAMPGNLWSSGDMIRAGFEQYEHDGDVYENGWHPGQDDDPKAIMAAAKRDRGEDVDVVFLLNSTGQFDIRFTCWVREKDKES